MNDVNYTLVFLLIFLALLGLASIVIALKFWGNADLHWKWQRKYYRHGGVKPTRTKEWEASRKIPLVLLFVVGAASLLGAIGWGVHYWTLQARRALEKTRFDELELSHCALGTVAFTNRATASRFVTIGPVRGATSVTTHPDWKDRQVSLGMTALGDGMISTQQQLEVWGDSTLEIRPGETGAFVLRPGSGSCSSVGTIGGANSCTKLIFGFKVAQARGASLDLDLVRYCEF